MVATAAADTPRHVIEDAEDPAGPEAIRTRLKLTQKTFAAAIGVPQATVQNWEQHRVRPDPAARALLIILEREPEAALRALAPA